MSKYIVLLLFALSINVTMAQTRDVSADFGLTDKPENSVQVKKEFVGVPIKIEIPANKESRVEFFSPIQKVGIREEVTNNIAFESYSNQLLLKVNKSLNTRIKLQLQGNIVVPVDLRVVDKSINPVALVVSLPEDHSNKSDVQSKQMVLTGYSKPNQKKLNAVELIRYAMQYFYSPSRLQKSAILGEPKELTQEPVKMYRTSMVETTPLVQWMLDGAYVTAIKVENKLSNAVPLDPRLLRGKLRLASFYRNKLAPKGTRGDDTVLITVSDTPLKSLDLKVIEIDSEDDDG